MTTHPYQHGVMRLGALVLLVCLLGLQSSCRSFFEDLYGIDCKTVDANNRCVHTKK